MEPLKLTADLEGPGNSLAGALVCLGIAGAMSMTFLEANWGNVGSVGVVLALLGFGAVSGVVLLGRAARLSARRQAVRELSLVLPDGPPRPGRKCRFEVEFLPGGEQKLVRAEVACRLVEIARREGEPMAPEVGVLHERVQRFEPGVGLKGDRPWTGKGELGLPPEVLQTFCLEYHQVDLSFGVKLGCEPGGEVEYRWSVPLAGEGSAKGDALGELRPVGTATGIGLRSLPGAPAPRAGGELAVVLEVAPGSGVTGPVEVMVLGRASGGSEEERVLGSATVGGGPGAGAEAGSPWTSEVRIALGTGFPASFSGQVVEVSWEVRISTGGSLVAVVPLRVLPPAGGGPDQEPDPVS